jgi:hypothetical protein
MDEQKDVMCDGCVYGNRASTPHSCPFQEEMNGDDDTKCACCDDCRLDCLGDI